MDEDPFAVELAEALSQRIELPVQVLHGGDSLTVPLKGGRCAQINLANFRDMHDRGSSVCEIADGLAAAFFDGGKGQALSPDDARAHVIVHLVPKGSASGAASQPVSPFVEAVLALDRPRHIRFLMPDDLANLEIPGDELASLAAENMARLATEHPGEATPLTDAFTATVFTGNLAADRAYAHALALDEAAAVFAYADLAFVCADTGAEALRLMAQAGMVMAARRELDHPISSAVHLFREGALVGVGFAALADGGGPADQAP